MAVTVIVEDGSGKADSNSYVSLDQFKEYCSARGYDITQKTDEQMNIMIVESTQNTDIRFVEQYIGERYSTEQALEWPRIRAVGSYTKKPYSQPVMPDLLINQTCERAYRLLISELGFVTTNWQEHRIIQSESKSLDGVGSKSTTYSDQSQSYTPTNVQQLQTYLTQMMRDLLKKTPVVGSIGLVRSL